MLKENNYLCLADVAGIDLELNTVIRTESFILTNSLEFIFTEVVIDRQLFFQKFGEVQTLGFLNSHTYLIVEVDGSNTDFTHVTNNLLAQLIHQFWKIKDNSVFVSGFYYIPKVIKNHFIYSRLNFQNYNSSGQVSKTVFTNAEIELTLNLLDDEQMYISEKSRVPTQLLGELVIHTTQESIGYNDMSRMERGMGFIINARKISLLPMRITNYMSFLECLFSTGNSEVTHQVSERISLFLSQYNNDIDKLDTYKFIKNCYAIRSKYVHGDKLENKHKELYNLQIYSQRLDDICRSVINDIFKKNLDVFNDNNKDNTNDYFLKLIFE